MRGLSVDHAALGLVKVEPFTTVSLEFALFPVIPDSDFLLCFLDFSFLIVVTVGQLEIAFTFNMHGGTFRSSVLPQVVSR